ncbi:hypothetical protein [Lentibacter sp.]|jgi:hypothetical protein|uniref:hypothetical protein n=1 Tax=Lentibacter sp. TaxID=2024994 RepID=UPI0032D93E3C
MNPIWELNKMDGKNPTHTGGFLTGYDQREFSPEEVAARESGQNAMDAGRNVSGITQLVFQKLVATGDQKDVFLEDFKLRELLAPRLAVFEKEERNRVFAASVKKFLEGDEIQALLIRDYNTCGLGGAWDRYERGDHFARLVCALNLDDKADGDSSSGGSFGLGKTTYAKSSSINTVIYHSVFEATEDTKGENRRLMAAGVYPKHNLEKDSFGGFAYFGEQLGTEDGVAAPFHSQNAETYWNKVSDVFSADLTRKPSETGTDILILMNNLDFTKLKKAIEDYYFPALISKQLAVRFIDENGNHDAPQVYNRTDLDQFVRLYKKAVSNEVIKEETLRVDNFNKSDGLEIGRFAYEAAEPDEEKSPRNNCVAIMRGTGMVINYVKIGGDQYESAVGVFVAAKDMHPYLQASENAAHSEWGEHSSRLAQKFDEKGRIFVRRVNSVVKSRFIEFQKGLQPDVSHTRSESGLLARLLTGALSGTKGDKPVIKPFHNPVALSLQQKKRDEKISIWNVRIRENEFTPNEPFTLKFFPSISLAGDSKLIAIKHMDFTIKDQNGKIIKEESNPELSYPFQSGMGLDFQVEIPNPGRNNYVVQWKCVAEDGEFNVD